MSIYFPYEKKVIDEGHIFDPRINLQVQTKRGFLTIKFLVDSGADVTTLPFNPYAELFNFKINPNKRVIIGRVEGRRIDGYPFTLKIRIQKFEFKLRSYFLKSKIDPLLGRLDFWNLFSINFDNKSLKTILTKI